MSLILSGTDGLSDIDGTAATPAIRGTDTNTGIYFPAADTIAFTEGSVEAMRIDSSGNVCVGSTAAGNAGAINVSVGLAGTTVGGLQLWSTTNSTHYVNFGDGTTGTDTYRGYVGYAHASDALLFGTSTAERMRITSGGDLIVGGTTVFSNARVTFNSTTAANPCLSAFKTVTGDTANPAIVVSKFDNDSTTAQIIMQFLFNNGASGLGQINGNGSGAAAFGSYSDIRLKENITNIDSQLGNICALRPVEFDYKTGGHQIGFIAQEMQEIYPDAVGTSANDMLTITGWSKTEARLVKAIQEQQAQIEELKQEVALLKSK